MGQLDLRARHPDWYIPPPLLSSPTSILTHRPGTLGQCWARALLTWQNMSGTTPELHLHFSDWSSSCLSLCRAICACGCTCTSPPSNHFHPANTDGRCGSHLVRRRQHRNADHCAIYESHHARASVPHLLVRTASSATCAMMHVMLCHPFPVM